MNKHDAPAGATHWAPAFGNVSYYRHSTFQRMNQVSEELQILHRWEYWDLGKWNPVEAGFCSRHCKEIT